MTTAERRDRLTQAQQLITEVREDLDTQGSACTTCGLKRYANWSEYLLHTQLAGMSTRLQSLITKFLPPA